MFWVKIREKLENNDKIPSFEKKFGMKVRDGLNPWGTRDSSVFGMFNPKKSRVLKNRENPWGTRDSSSQHDKPDVF